MPNRRNRVVGLLALLLLATALLAPSPAATAATLPSDVKGHWAAGEIEYVVDAGLMNGYPDGSFKPDTPISRGEVYTLLARQKGLSGGSVSLLPAGWDRKHWAAPNGAALVQSGVLLPAEDPQAGQWDAPITRAALSRLVVRLQGLSHPQNGVNELAWDIQGRADAGWISTAIAQGLMTGYPNGSFGPDDSFTRAQTATVMHRLRDPAVRPTVWRELYSYARPDGGTAKLQVIRANLRNPKVKVKTAYSPSGIGHTLSLPEMLPSGAVAAINGTYFNAYNKQEIQDPYGTLVSGGQLVHFVGSPRPAIGIWPGGQAKLGPFQASIQGSTNGKTGWPNGWYAYGVNHIGSDFGPNWVSIMTPARGSTTGMETGLNVVVRGGKVVAQQQGAAAIPRDGYLINLGGVEASNFQGTLKVGSTVDWQVKWPGGWEDPVELIQAGPLLVQSGKVDVDFARDQFTEAKITEWVGNRSAVGMTADGTLLLVVADAVKVLDLAPMMIDLGAMDAMCMDSGASSGLWYKGEYLWEPGRPLTNSLAIIVE